ncbi:MAG: hypothetical protein ACI97A_001380 [Planctomycetota bacterium]|jgi:hypothetical protein
MKTSLWTAILALVILTSCASDPVDTGEGMKATDTAAPAVGFTEEESRARTERRLQLERSMDQWWLAFQRQEYGKSDGIAKALEVYVNEHFSAVVGDLETASPRFRKVAAASLGFSGKQTAVPALLVALRDPFSDVLFGSLLSLWRLSLMPAGSISIPANEITPFLSHGDPGIRSNAAMVMAHITKPGDGVLFLPLTAAMEDNNAKVRLHAAAALGALGDPDAVPFLSKGLDDKMSLVRMRSALALGRIESRRALRPLVAHIEDPDVDVAKAVHKALMRISGQKIDRIKNDWENYIKNAEF